MDSYSFLNSHTQNNPSYKRNNWQSSYNSYNQKELADSDMGSLKDEKYMRSYALQLAHQGEYTKAIALLNRIIDSHPENAIDYNNRGLIYFQSGHAQKALLDYNTAMQLNPRLASVYNNRANYYAADGDLVKALSDYDQALDLNPRHVRAWINRGITLRELGKYKDSIDDFEIALLFGQLEIRIWSERGRSYHLWGDWNCAIADYRRVLSHTSSLDKIEDIITYRLRLQVENWLGELGFSTYK